MDRFSEGAALRSVVLLVVVNLEASHPRIPIAIEVDGNANFYVSIHFNGYGDPRVRGLEVYYNEENHGAESRALAKSIQGELLAQVREAGYPLFDRGVKEDLAAGKPYRHFFSLRGGRPSVLVESMFLTNPYEASQ